VRERGWEAPLYWRRQEKRWTEFTLAGNRELVASEPVSHVSYFEADAFARWAGARLPTEAEWEVAAEGLAVSGNFVDNGRFHPSTAQPNRVGLQQMFGDLWQWTQSAYSPYPGFQPEAGALSEYNGKFMCNQFVLRGGSCVTSRDHTRATYRNFFHPPDRWLFSGIRLAKDC
jgi:ergothioneine biosynthesis protein EgtB